VVLGDKVNGALIAIVLRYRMMRHSVICSALFCAFQLSAHATTLLPSQEEHDLATVKICRDHEVLTSLKAAIDRSLQARSVLARGMHAGDVHLEAVWIDRPAVVGGTSRNFGESPLQGPRGATRPSLPRSARRVTNFRESGTCSASVHCTRWTTPVREDRHHVALCAGVASVSDNSFDRRDILRCSVSRHG
jgi:hypothetical protein